MKRDVLMKPLESSFLSCEKDTETILRRLFVECKQHSKVLKRLLVIMNEGCLEDKAEYAAVNDMSVKQLIDNKYLVLSPKIQREEHDQIGASIILSFNNFIPNATNPEFRDCTIYLDVLCPLEHWDLTNFQLRPFKILGYIDGMLNGTRLSGIGKLEFLGCAGPVIDENYGLFQLSYRAVHGSDDQIPNNEE